MPIRGGSPPPQRAGRAKQFRSGSPPPRSQAWGSSDEEPRTDRGRRKRKTKERRGVVTPLQIPARAGSSRLSDRRRVSPRATTWDDLPDTEDEHTRLPRSERGRRRKERGAQSGQRRSGRTDRSAKTSRAARREPHWKEDDDRVAQAVERAVFHDAHAEHEAIMLDEEHRKRFHSHQAVFMLGALLLLLPVASMSVFTGALILAFPIPGMMYGAICAAAAWHSHQVLLYLVVGGAVPMIARVSIAMYVLAVMTRKCREAAACEGTYTVAWLGLGAEMFGTLVAVVAAMHHMHVRRKTRIMQERTVIEAAEEKLRRKGVAELRKSLRQTFKSWGSELELIFKDFDEDGNGMMDREELCQGLKTLGANFSDEQASWLFDKIDVDKKGEIDYRTFAAWFGTTKQAERAKAQELKAARQDKVYIRWKHIYEQVRYSIRKRQQLADIRHGRGQWDKIAIEACFDEFDDGDGELEVEELHQAFEMLHMDPTAEEIEALLGIYDADGSGTLDKEEFVRMMYEFIQNREPASTDEEAEDDPDPGESTTLTGPEHDGTYPPSDGVVSVSVVSCTNLLAADRNGLSDPYVELKMGANGNMRKTRVIAKTLNPIFAQTFQLKLRRLPSRVGDQILRMTVYDFDRLESDDVLGNLELDMWKVFDKNWAQEVEKSWPFNDDYGAVDHKLVQKASADKEHLYGTVRLRLSFSTADYASDESFSDEDMDDKPTPSPKARVVSDEASVDMVVEGEVYSSDEDQLSEAQRLRNEFEGDRDILRSSMVL